MYSSLFPSMFRGANPGTTLPRPPLRCCGLLLRGTCATAAFLAAVACSPAPAAIPTAAPTSVSATAQLAPSAPGSPVSLGNRPSPSPSIPVAQASPSAVSSPASAVNGPLTQVTIAIPGVDLTQFHVQVPLDQGFFKQHGLDVTLTQMGATAGLAALQSGDVQFSTVTGSAARAAIQGLPVRVVAYTQIVTFSLVSAANVTSLADLKDKRVGISGIGGDDDRYTHAALATVNMQPSDTQYLAVGSAADVFKALQGGEIDAGVVAAPFTQELQQQGFHVLTGPDLLEFPSGGFAATPDQLQKQPQLIAAVLASIADGIAWTKSHPDEAAQYFAQKYDLSPDIAQAAYQQQVAALKSSWTDDELTAIIQRGVQDASTTRQVGIDDVFNRQTFDEYAALAQQSGPTS